MPGTTVGEDHIVGVERQVLIDPKSGVGDGNIGVVQQQRITGYQTGYGSMSPGQFK